MCSCRGHKDKAVVVKGLYYENAMAKGKIKVQDRKPTNIGALSLSSERRWNIGGGGEVNSEQP